MKRFLLLIPSLLFLALPAAAQISNPAIDARFGNWYTEHAQATPVVAGASDFTAVADVSGSLAGTYFYVHAAGNAYCIQPWYKVSGTGSAPTPQTGCTLLEVDVLTNDTAATVAGDTRTALNTTPYTTYFTISGATTHVILTNTGNGAATAGNVGTSGFSVSNTAGVSGALAAASPQNADQGWRICNAGVNTSTYLVVGPNSLDPTTSGIRLAPGACYECLSCPTGLLRSLYVSSQAAANDYSVVEFKN